MVNKISVYILFLILFIQFYTLKLYAYENFDGKYRYNKYNSEQSTASLNSNEDEVLFILDVSGSMSNKLGYSPKLYLAVDAIRNILKESGNNIKIGLRVFGFNINNTGKYLVNSTNRRPEADLCRETSLVLPISKYNSENISDKLSQLRAYGQSPIGYSLRQAVQNDFSINSKLKHIILITDGGENCGDDPCAYIKRLMQLRDDFIIDVIGITVEDNAYSQLNCIASAGKGKYYAIKSENDFKIILKEAMKLHNINSDNDKPAMPVKKTSKNIVPYDGTKYKNYVLQFDY